MARTWGRAVVCVLAATLLAACETAGQATAPEPTPTEQAAADLRLPCQPGSGEEITSTGPMTLTDMSGDDLSCAVFDDLTMNQVRLRDSDLPGATFRSSTLNRVDFTGASLIGAIFEDTTLNVPDFTDADLRGARLSAAQLNTPVWTGAMCPDGTQADTSCDGHLDPLSIEEGPAKEPTPEPTTTTTETEEPPTTSSGAPPAGQAAPSVFNDPADGTYACTGGSVAINGAGSDIHLTGECDDVLVNGAGSSVEVDAANRILVNGARAHVTYHGNPQVAVTGAGASADPA